jgi:DNA-binding PadR family transcriptional regulator
MALQPVSATNETKPRQTANLAAHKTTNNRTLLMTYAPSTPLITQTNQTLFLTRCFGDAKQNHLPLQASNFFTYIEDMSEHSYLGEFELMLLLTIIRLGDEAYGVPLSRDLAKRRGREISVGSVYAALDRLETKGLVTSSLGESTPERGGRAKRYFRVTRQGLRAVHETRKVLTKLWQSLPSLEKAERT